MILSFETYVVCFVKNIIIINNLFFGGIVSSSIFLSYDSLLEFYLKLYSKLSIVY